MIIWCKKFFSIIIIWLYQYFLIFSFKSLNTYAACPWRQGSPQEGWRGPARADTWCPRGPPDHCEDDGNGDWDYDDVHVVHLIHYDHDDGDDGDYDHGDLAMMIPFNL